MSGCKQLSVKTEDHAPQKWSVSLKEDTFKRFMAQGTPAVHKIFGDGSLFSPLLFGKFFDPSDAFPLWEFESEILLSSLRSSKKTTVDWSQSDHEYSLKAEIPGTYENSEQVIVDSGKVVEISGQWRQYRESNTKDWRCGNWWEYGYVRRLELPEDADGRNIEARLSSDTGIELKIPKKKDSSREGKTGSSKDPEPV